MLIRPSNNLVYFHAVAILHECSFNKHHYDSMDHYKGYFQNVCSKTKTEKKNSQPDKKVSMTTLRLWCCDESPVCVCECVCVVVLPTSTHILQVK